MIVAFFSEKGHLFGETKEAQSASVVFHSVKARRPFSEKKATNVGSHFDQVAGTGGLRRPDLRFPDFPHFPAWDMWRFQETVAKENRQDVRDYDQRQLIQDACVARSEALRRPWQRTRPRPSQSVRACHLIRESTPPLSEKKTTDVSSVLWAIEKVIVRSRATIRCRNVRISFGGGFRSSIHRGICSA